MQALIDYVSRYSPGFAESVRGASRFEIEELERRAQRPLTPHHWEYLATMGQSSGDFQVYHGDVDLRISALLRFYQEAHVQPPPDSTLVGRNISGSGMDLYLQQIPESPRPIVIQSSGQYGEGEPAEIFVEFPNLANFLFSAALSEYRLNRLPYQATLQDAGIGPRGPAGAAFRLQSLAQVTREFQLVPLPFTGGWVPCYENDQVALRAYEPAGGGPTYSLAAAGLPAFNHIQAWLEARIGLIRVR